jgi:lipopolysaccharide transport system permease protein
VFESRWSNATGPTPPMEFAIILFVGLVLFQLFGDVFSRAPGLIVANSNYVTKVVFPLELLVPSAVLAAAFHALISFVLLVPFVWFVFGPLSWTALYLPLIAGLLMLMTAGLAWFLASIGTFVRDIGQAVGTITTALMFLSPIFFPVSSMPEWIRPFIHFNPLTVPITEAREVLVFGNLPDFQALGIYGAVALLVALAGFRWFQRTRKAFADVL